MSFYSEPVFEWAVVIGIFVTSAIATLIALELMSNEANPDSSDVNNNSESRIQSTYGHDVE